MGYIPSQQIIIQTVKDSPIWLKIVLSLIPIIGAFLLGKIIRRKK